SRRHPQASIVVLEAEERVGFHQSGHNSGVLHSGLYYTPGSLKARLCVEGRRRMVEFCEENGIAHDVTGKLVSPSTGGRRPDSRHSTNAPSPTACREPDGCRRGSGTTSSHTSSGWRPSTSPKRGWPTSRRWCAGSPRSSPGRSAHPGGSSPSAATRGGGTSGRNPAWSSPTVSSLAPVSRPTGSPS